MAAVLAALQEQGVGPNPTGRHAQAVGDLARGQIHTYLVMICGWRGRVKRDHAPAMVGVNRQPIHHPAAADLVA